MSVPCPLRGSEKFVFVIDPIRRGNIEGENWKKTGSLMEDTHESSREKSIKLYSWEKYNLKHSTTKWIQESYI